MRRLVIAGVIAVAAMGIGAASVPAPAAAGFLSHERAQDRAINRLQGQVATLQVQVEALRRGLFTCEFHDSSTPTTFMGGTVGYPVYWDSRC